MNLFNDKICYNIQDIETLRKENILHEKNSYNFLVNVSCSLQVSYKCKKVYVLKYANAKQSCKNNNGKIVCKSCFNERTQRNKLKYKTIDDNFFYKIDTKEKAYLLGVIASDGSIHKKGNEINICVGIKDIEWIKLLKNIICKELDLYYKSDLTPISKQISNSVGFRICSKQIAKDVCRHLNINPGKKDFIVQMPQNISDHLKWYFLRGYFEGDGFLSIKEKRKETIRKYPRCDITSSSIYIREQIRDFVKNAIPEINILERKRKKEIYFTNKNAILFLNKIYNNAFSDNLILTRKFYLYNKIKFWEPSINDGRKQKISKNFKITKTSMNAKYPIYKNNTYYFEIINFNLNESIYWLDTGLKIELFTDKFEIELSDNIKDYLNLDIVNFEKHKESLLSYYGTFKIPVLVIKNENIHDLKKVIKLKI